MDASGIVVPLLVAAVVSAALTPLCWRIAEAVGAVDRPSERSVAHRAGIPLLGGLGVALGTGAGLYVAIAYLAPELEVSRLHGLVLGAVIVLALGAIDDRFGLGAVGKFAGQLLAAAIAIHAGFRMEYLTDPITRTSYFFSEPLVWAASALWIVGITNALNLIDGLDGLASGVGAIISLTLAVIAWQTGSMFGVCLGVSLFGGLIGFLPYNFPPARIFLGDTGALFAGYLLALLSLEGYRQATVITFVVPLLALALPILDTLISIARRALRGDNPFRADRLHIHHRLLATRGSARAAVLQFWFLTACFALIAVSFTDLHGAVAAAGLALVLLLTVRVLLNLGVLALTTGAADDSIKDAALDAEEEKS